MKQKRLAGSKKTSIAQPVKTDASERQYLKKVVQDIRDLRKGAALGKITIRELIDEGRRY